MLRPFIVKVSVLGYFPLVFNIKYIAHYSMYITWCIHPIILYIYIYIYIYIYVSNIHIVINPYYKLFNLN